MTYISETGHSLKCIQPSLGKQLSNAFRYFIHLTIGTENTMNINARADAITTRNCFIQQYQQLLEKGETKNVLVVKVESAREEKVNCNNAIYLSFRLITEKGAKIFRAAAMAPKDKTPEPNTIIPIYYNPDDLSTIVLL